MVVVVGNGVECVFLAAPGHRPGGRRSILLLQGSWWGPGRALSMVPPSGGAPTVAPGVAC